MSKKLTILFAPMDGVGSVNACVGLAEGLLSRGHKIVFVVSKVFKGKLVPYSFHEELLEVTYHKKDIKPGEEGANSVLVSGLLDSKSSLEKMKLHAKITFFYDLIDHTIEVEPQIKQIVAKHKPDLFIMDTFVASPTLIYSDIPWVFVCSGNPLFLLDDERTAPGSSGFPANGDSTSDEWKQFRKINDEVFLEHNQIYNKWLNENGYPSIDKRMIPLSPYLNIYGFPQELDYTDIRPLPEKWINVDSFMRKNEPGEFTLPEKIRNRDEKKEKIIYFSMGSMGGSNIPLMKRLVQILSKAPHKVIVSKGLMGDEFELADNMWGKNSVPQTKVLPLVDLVITHGGNNTVTEAFSFGKPMIVMPLFGDQFDNAQRVHEKGFGLRMDAHNCTEEELLEGIEKLLNDSELKKRLSAAAKRLTTSHNLLKACEVIEKLIK